MSLSSLLYRNWYSSGVSRQTLYFLYLENAGRLLTTAISTRIYIFTEYHFVHYANCLLAGFQPCTGTAPSQRFDECALPSFLPLLYLTPCDCQDPSLYVPYGHCIKRNINNRFSILGLNTEMGFKRHIYLAGIVRNSYTKENHAPPPKQISTAGKQLWLGAPN